MFFVTYVRRELRRRMRQAIFVALGLALGVGLVVTVAAASAGVARAQDKVLSTLYGQATTVTVTGGRWQQPATLPKGTDTIEPGPGGEICSGTPGGKCVSGAGKTLTMIDILVEGISEAKVAAAARLPGVAAAAGGIFLNQSTISWPKNGARTARGAACPAAGGRAVTPWKAWTPHTRRWARWAARR